MKILVAPLEMKGFLSARAVAEALREGLVDAGASRDEIALLPLADGGPGTLDAFAALGFSPKVVPAHDPLGRPIEARYLPLREDAAFIELAEASGLQRLSPDERAPLTATTFGTGEVILAAIEDGHTDLIIGAGGSATTDGGTGALAALGFSFLDGEGKPLPPGGAALRDLAEVRAWTPPSPLLRFSVLTDVRTPLLGEHGAANLFGPQKGATVADVHALESGLISLSGFGPHGAEGEPGAGAAGGFAYGFHAFVGASLASGFDHVARRLGLDAMLSVADLIITAEGQLDRQSSLGKGAVEVARRARKLGKRVVAAVGLVGRGADRAQFDELHETPARSPDEARARLRALGPALLVPPRH